MPSPYFGRSPFYNIISDIDDPSQDQVIKNTSRHFGGKRGPPRLLKDHNVDILIAVGLGKRAIEHFKETNIQIFKTERVPVKGIIKKFSEKKLTLIEEPCGHSNNHN